MGLGLGAVLPLGLGISLWVCLGLGSSTYKFYCLRQCTSKRG